nr:MAG TPA: hypothetical protein [Caudoviricetes sp.]
MPNKPTPADFGPTVPDFPVIGQYQPIYGKFDLTTYIQGASDYEIMAFLVQCYNATLKGYSEVTQLSKDTVTAYNQLQTWVNTWFANLDIQPEINAKIQEMYENGSLATAIASSAVIGPAMHDYLNTEDGTANLYSATSKKIDTMTDNGVLTNIVKETGQVPLAVNAYLASVDGTKNLSDAVANKIEVMAANGELGAVISKTADVQKATTDWLTANVTPVGSAVIVDKSLTVTGAAADANVTGDKITNIADSNVTLQGELGYRTPSGNGNITTNAEWRTVMAKLSDVTLPYGFVINDNLVSFYQTTIPSYFFLDGNKVSISDSAVFKNYNDFYLPIEKIPSGAVYICLNHYGTDPFKLRVYSLRDKADDSGNEFVRAYKFDTANYSRAGKHYFPLKLKKGDIVKVVIGEYVQSPSQYSLEAVDGVKTSASKHTQLKPLAAANDTVDAKVTVKTMDNNYNGFYFYIPDKNNDPKTIEIFVRKNRICERDVIRIASINASEEEKISANIVCDGVNDELDIQNAIDLLPSTGTVVLSSGDFYFDNSYTFKDEINNSCVCGYPKYHNSNYFIRGKGDRLGDGNTIIHVRNTVFGTGETSIFNNFIANFYADTGVFHFCGLNISDVNIECESGNKNGVVIDLAHSGHGVLHDIALSCTNTGLDYTKFTTGLVGIRGYNGYSTGHLNTMDRIAAEGFSTAFQLGGEHVVGTNMTARMNYIGFSFGAYVYTFGTFDHSITLINCADEHSCKLPQFVGNGAAFKDTPSRQEVDMISLNIEIVPEKFVDYASEKTPNSFCGRIEYTIGGVGENVTADWKFWKDGSGHLFNTRNMAMSYVGNTATRKSYHPEFNQSYYDTDLNKMLWFINGNWVDANGTVAT